MAIHPSLSEDRRQARRNVTKLRNLLVGIVIGVFMTTCFTNVTYQNSVKLSVKTDCSSCPSSLPSLSLPIDFVKANDPPQFILIRILGNNLPPLHSPGQIYKNVKYILENESNFKKCEKRWLINYMANSTERGLLLDLFHEYGYRHDQILVKRIDQKKLEGLNERNWPLYEMNIISVNEGRNFALEDGFRAGARWVMVLDACQFVTRQSWKSFENTVRHSEKKGFQYIKIPMFRLLAEQQSSFLNSESMHNDVLQFAPYKGESQIAFRNDSINRFDATARFGSRDKLQFLFDVCGRSRSKKKCGCGDAYPEILEGMEGWNKTVPKYPEIMKRCGYTVRLWPYPCNEPLLKNATSSLTYRPLIRIEGRQRLMYYVMGKFNKFEDVCGRETFTLTNEQVVLKKHMVVLCKPWGEEDCMALMNKGLAKTVFAESKKSL